MKCSICHDEIEKQYTPDGVMFWDKGHNPWPVSKGADDRCCGICNDTKVITARLFPLLKKHGLHPGHAKQVTEALSRSITKLVSDESGSQAWEKALAGDDPEGDE